MNLANPTQQNMEAENRAYKRWDHVSNLEESFLKQKLKMHWLKKGDKNNKSFIEQPQCARSGTLSKRFNAMMA